MKKLELWFETPVIIGSLNRYIETLETRFKDWTVIVIRSCNISIL